MVTTTSTLVAPAAPGPDHAGHRPLDLRSVRFSSGPLAEWQRKNRESTIPHCIEQLEVSGVLDNFRRVVGESGAPFRGFVFADSDLYKVIEAVAWEIGRSGATEFDDWLDAVIGLVQRTTERSGYLNTWIQGVHPEKKFAEMEHSHELYCLGHLIQAAVALDRTAGRDDLLVVATRFADLVDRRFGPGREEGICGHPEIETALIELYRHTTQPRYLALAERMIELRGHGLLPVGGFGARYFQDHLAVRDATVATGHAVRQLYLNSGVTDLYLENGDRSLLQAMDAQWSSVHDRKMYLTGAFGSRHRDEAFGEDYELPSERAYAETCATIADLEWSWRMLLADGEAGSARYAETMEREIHNALAAAIDASGTRFFYSNPVQQRPDRVSEENAPRVRTPWYSCACCPPNIARTVASLSGYVATATADRLSVHLLADVEIDLPPALGVGTVRIQTRYPDQGEVEISFTGQTVAGAELSIRMPSRLLSHPSGLVAGADGYACVALVDGLSLRLELDLGPRVRRAHHRVDALRGCLAVERGPVVYCVEQADLPEGLDVDDLALVHDTAFVWEDGKMYADVAVVQAGTELYSSPSVADRVLVDRVPLIPFATWGNRTPGAMRVWIPAASAGLLAPGA